MTELNFDQLLSTTVDSVLQTMFFTVIWGPAEPETNGAVLESRLAFHGHPSGTFDVCLSEPSARLLAAAFLGENEESLTDSQTGQVVCELANMLCGSLVSTLQSDESFELDSPELVASGSEIVSDFEALPAARQSFALDGGIFTVTLYVGASA
jgi:CheY-specific phosphatase CheX